MPNRADKVLSGDDFMVFLKSRGISKREVAKWFGVKAQSVDYYEEHGLSKTQALALSALDHCLRPWSPTDEDRKAAEQQIKPPEE